MPLPIGASNYIGGLRFATDDDAIREYPKLDELWPRKDRNGKAKNDWDIQHLQAMEEIERRMRAAKSTAEPIELGRIGIRTKERMRPVAACFAVHFIFIAADTHGDNTGFYAGKADYFYERAVDILTDELQMVDYDQNNDGKIDDFEKNQPMPQRFIRG